jgi:hypothetical protein
MMDITRCGLDIAKSPIDIARFVANRSNNITVKDALSAYQAYMQRH